MIYLDMIFYFRGWGKVAVLLLMMNHANASFFYDDESQIVDMQFIDRMNLYFKLGLAAKVKFNAEEQELIEMVADCNSWKDVLAATRAIMEFTAQEMRNAEVEELDGEGQEGESMEMSPENGFGDIEGMSKFLSNSSANLTSFLF